MFKKTMILILSFFLLVSFISCDFSAYSYVKSNEKFAFVLAGYHIPGASDGLNVQVELIDEDSFGRKMYRFSCLSPSGNLYADGYDEEADENLRAYLISQKEDDEGVYFIDSVCYMARHSWDDFSSDSLTEFKTLNRWEEDMDESNLCFRPLPDSKFGGTTVNPLFSEVRFAYTEYTGREIVNSQVNISYVCNDAEGKCLAFVREYDEELAECAATAYVIIAVPSNSGEVFYVAELNDFYQHNDEVRKLKEEANWISP